MNRVILTASAVALAFAVTPALAKKDRAIVAVNIDAPAGTPQPIAVSGVAADAMLPANTEVMVRTTTEINSKKMREGEAFTAVVANDVMMGNAVVIPKNTVVNGIITWRTGKGVYGKSAKMDYELRSFDLNGQRYGLTGKFHQEGKGNTGATVATAVIAGPIFGMFVTGKSAIVEQGRELKAYTASAIPLGGSVATTAVAAPAVQTVAPVPAAPTETAAPAK